MPLDPQHVRIAGLGGICIRLGLERWSSVAGYVAQEGKCDVPAAQRDAKRGHPICRWVDDRAQMRREPRLQATERGFAGCPVMPLSEIQYPRGGI